MLLVLLDHIGYIAINPPSLYDITNEPVLSLWRFNQQAFTTICVNLFVLISGWFGINFKKIRIAELIFQTFFICFFVYFLLIICNFANPMSPQDWLKFLVFDDLWFVKAYLVLYIFAPMMNCFIENISQRQFQWFILAFFLIQTIHGFLTTTTLWFKEGMSPLSLMGIYFIGRYLRLYPKGLTEFSKWVYMTSFLTFSELSTFFAYFSVKFGAEGYRFYSYASPLIILSAISFFLFFAKLSFSSKIVNWIAISSFAAYVLHSEPHAFNLYISMIVSWWQTNPPHVFYSKALLLVCGIFIISILVDKVRIYFWAMLKRYFS